MAERFFNTPNQTRAFSSLGTPNLPPITLLSGPPSCGKTSLLFQFAYNSALQSSSNIKPYDVVFISKRHHLETSPPFLSQGIDQSSDVFRRIKMKYVDDEESLKKYFAAFHMQEVFPAVVIIDDFGEFFDERSCRIKYGSPRGRDLSMIRILALCHSAIVHANNKGPCELILADTHQGDTPRLLYIYKKWISSIFTIRGDGCRSFHLKSSRKSEEYSKAMTAKYSIALQYLLLEGITEDTEQ